MEVEGLRGGGVVDAAGGWGWLGTRVEEGEEEEGKVGGGKKEGAYFLVGLVTNGLEGFSRLRTLRIGWM